MELEGEGKFKCGGKDYNIKLIITEDKTEEDKKEGISIPSELFGLISTGIQYFINKKQNSNTTTNSKKIANIPTIPDPPVKIPVVSDNKHYENVQKVFENINYDEIPTSPSSFSPTNKPIFTNTKKEESNGNYKTDMLKQLLLSIIEMREQNEETKDDTTTIFFKTLNSVLEKEDKEDSIDLKSILFKTFLGSIGK